VIEGFIQDFSWEGEMSMRPMGACTRVGAPMCPPIWILFCNSGHTCIQGKETSNSAVIH